jgi:uncharacterized membrane protein YhaH (DUF805 family)
MEAFQMYFLDVIKNKYCVFSGRARRKEYWMFMLFFYGIMLAVSAIIGILAYITGSGAITSILGVVVTLACLGLLPTMMGLLWRRLHDTGKSGWWNLLNLAGLGIVIFVFTCLDSTPGSNQYGPNPKGMDGQMANDVFV